MVDDPRATSASRPSPVTAKVREIFQLHDLGESLCSKGFKAMHLLHNSMAVKGFNINRHHDGPVYVHACIYMCVYYIEYL